MSWTLLLVLSALCAGSVAQFSLSQEPSVTVAPGQTVKLSCTRSSGAVGSYYVSWCQQKPDTVPKLVMHSFSSRPSGVPSRFSGSYDNTPNAAYLTITGVEAEDDAVYYCQSYDSSGSYIFGGGTQLNVLTGETKGPTLSIFPPSQEEVEKDKSTVVCLYQDFYPASVDVTWTVGGQTITNGVEKSRATKQSENNLFMASSYLSLPTTDWSTNKEVTCQVTHQGKSFAKSVKKSECV